MTRLTPSQVRAGRPHPEGPLQEGQWLGRAETRPKTAPEASRGPEDPGSYRPSVDPLLSDASAQGACAATAVCVKAGARRDGGGGGEGGDGGDDGGRGGGGHDVEPLQAGLTCVAEATSLRNIVGVSRPRDRPGEVGPGRTCCAGPGRGHARPPHPVPARARTAPRPSAAGSGGGDGG